MHAWMDRTTGDSALRVCSVVHAAVAACASLVLGSTLGRRSGLQGRPLMARHGTPQMRDKSMCTP